MQNYLQKIVRLSSSALSQYCLLLLFLFIELESNESTDFEIDQSDGENDLFNVNHQVHENNHDMEETLEDGKKEKDKSYT